MSSVEGHRSPPVRDAGECASNPNLVCSDRPGSTPERVIARFFLLPQAGIYSLTNLLSLTIAGNVHRTIWAKSSDTTEEDQDRGSLELRPRPTLVLIVGGVLLSVGNDVSEIMGKGHEPIMHHR